MSDGEGLPQLQLELVVAYEKRFMPQNGQVAVLQCSPIWEKMRKSFKALSEIKLKFILKAWKREAMARKTPLPSKGCSLKIEILTRLLFILIKPDNLFSCLKTKVDVSWVGAYLCFFSNSKKKK